MSLYTQHFDISTFSRTSRSIVMFQIGSSRYYLQISAPDNGHYLLKWSPWDSVHRDCAPREIGGERHAFLLYSW